MNATNDGGPAFPVDCNWQDGVPTSGVQTSSKTGMATGMTLRDYFAAKAMQGLLGAGRDAQYGQSSVDDLSSAAYFIADAMLEARGAA